MRATRKTLLQLALQMQDWDSFMQVLSFPDRVLRNANTCLREWGRHGAQSVIMPDTYAAALMATDAAAAITPETRLPWPAFEIVLPPKLLVGNDGSVMNVYVCETPSYVGPGPNGRDDYMVAYQDEQSWGYHSFRTLAQMVEPDAVSNSLSDYMIGPHDEDVELRVWKVLGRLIGGVLLAIENARAESRTAYPHNPPRVRAGKRPEMQANTYKLGRPLKLDLRPQIREYLEGVHRGGGGVPSVRTLVRGHWKKQVHGVGRALRKNIVVAPYYRGEGPTLIRATKLNPGGGDGFEGLYDEEYAWLA